jgi:hypothetical protein
VAKGNYGLLLHLFHLKIRVGVSSAEEPITTTLAPAWVLSGDNQRQLLPGRDRDFTPLNNHIFEFLRGLLREFVPGDQAYEDAFDWFEYLLGLVHCDLTAGVVELAQGNPRGPIGRFLWNRRSSGESIQQQTHFEPEGPYPAAVTAVLQAGFFASVSGSPNKRFFLIKRSFDFMIDRVREENVW